LLAPKLICSVSLGASNRSVSMTLLSEISENAQARAHTFMVSRMQET
jgi:hypothetical protein